MKTKLFSMAIMSAMAVITITSCSKDNKNQDNTQSNAIFVFVEKGSEYNVLIGSTVKAIGYYSLDGSSSLSYEVATANYENDGFTLNLPSTVDAQYLGNIKFSLDIPDNITISDTNTKVISIIEIKPYQNGSSLSLFPYHQFMYCKNPDSEVEYDYTEFVYVDRDVAITGASSEIRNGVTYNETYSVSLKQGWNRMYNTGTTDFKAQETKTATIRVTTTEVGGYKWYFIKP
jgi:hypothetical protein